MAPFHEKFLFALKILLILPTQLKTLTSFLTVQLLSVVCDVLLI